MRMCGAAVKCWRVNHDLPWPEPVECAVFGYPHQDATGTPMFDNTHFLDEAACWERVLANAEAGQALAVGDLNQTKAAVGRALRRLAEDATRFTNVLLAHAEWQRGTLQREPAPEKHVWPLYEPHNDDALPRCKHCGNAYSLHGLATNHCPRWAEEGKRGT